MRYFFISLIGLLAACEGEAPGARAPIDYEAINDAARGPAIAVQLDALEGDALATRRIEGAFCSVSRLNDPGPFVLATPEVAHAIVDGEPQTFAAWPGKSTLAFEVAQHFDGRAFTLEIAPTDRGALSQIGESAAIDAMVVLRDHEQRRVFEGFGTLECASAPPPT
ncbi:MAG: hypothetical protein V2I27_07410 [Erythrobacter sp.]|jgi:hypothetical protein|nr:hypothetical protein [Erythrobacter sp.]